MPDKIQENKKHIKEACDYFFGKDTHISSELPESKKDNIVWLRFFTLYNNYFPYLDAPTRKYVYLAIKQYFYHYMF